MASVDMTHQRAEDTPSGFVLRYWPIIVVFIGWIMGGVVGYYELKWRADDLDKRVGKIEARMESFRGARRERDPR